MNEVKNLLKTPFSSFHIQVGSEHVSKPWHTSVRFAKVKKRLSRVDMEFTDLAMWRKARGLESNPNKFGPLTNLPDYSFLDGRPVPLSQNLKKRLEKQREYAETIVRMSAELDFARDNYRQRQQAKAEEKRNIISNKLKPKGGVVYEKSAKTKTPKAV